MKSDSAQFGTPDDLLFVEMGVFRTTCVNRSDAPVRVVLTRRTETKTLTPILHPVMKVELPQGGRCTHPNDYELTAPEKIREYNGLDYHLEVYRVQGPEEQLSQPEIYSFKHEPDVYATFPVIRKIQNATCKPTRAIAVLESYVDVDPFKPWLDVEPQRSCVEELKQNAGIREAVPLIDRVIGDIQRKLSDIRVRGEESFLAEMTDDEVAAVVAYTHDLEHAGGKLDGNLFFELNKSLRLREGQGRRKTMGDWSVFVHFCLMGLNKMPNFEGLVLRCIPSKERVVDEYKLHRQIRWWAFTSSSTVVEAAEGFLDNSGEGLVFRIHVKRGKDIGHLSLFPKEHEILLWPGQSFTVTKAAYEENGFTYIDMEEADVLEF